MCDVWAGSVGNERLVPVRAQQQVQLTPNTRQTVAGAQLGVSVRTGAAVFYGTAHLKCQGNTGNCPIYFMSEAVLGLMSPQKSGEGSSINY